MWRESNPRQIGISAGRDIHVVDLIEEGESWVGWERVVRRSLVMSISLRGGEERRVGEEAETIASELANRFRREEVSLICLTRWR